MIAYVQPTLVDYLLTICTFVCGCQKENMMFLMSLLILSQVIEANHDTIGLLEVTYIKDVVMVLKLQESY